jgi:hypothetical protein
MVIIDVAECGRGSLVVRVYDSFHVSDRIRMGWICRGVESTNQHFVASSWSLSYIVPTVHGHTNIKKHTYICNGFLYGIYLTGKHGTYLNCMPCSGAISACMFLSFTPIYLIRIQRLQNQ